MMRIRRFNENVNVETEKIVNFINNLNDDLEDGVINWISDISTDTELIEYSIYDDPQKIRELIKNKEINSYEKLAITNKKIQTLEKEMELLHNKQDKLYTLFCGEFLYQFQRDLLERDFDSFYIYFIKIQFSVKSIKITCMRCKY